MNTFPDFTPATLRVARGTTASSTCPRSARTIRACPWCCGCCWKTSCATSAARARSHGGGAVRLVARRRQRSGNRLPARPRADARHHQHAGAGGYRRHARRAGRGRRRPGPAQPHAAGGRRSTTRWRWRSMPARTRPASTSATRSAATASATASCAGPPALRGVRIHPPGTGIMHTLNLEQLAVLVRELDLGGERWAAPDMMIGTDSHTPMINGIGVLGWGRTGSADGHVRHAHHAAHSRRDRGGTTGALPPGALATDLALTVTQRLRQIGVSGEFVEFFGPGVATLSAGSRAVVANMAPEYGATTGYFPPDERTLDYLRQTGRSADALDLARAYLRRNGLWFDPRPARATRAPSPSRWTASPATRPARAGRKTCCRWRACRPRWPRAARARPAGGRPAGLSRGHRRDHQLHQHLGPGAADRGRPAGAQGTRARTGRRRPGSRPRWGRARPPPPATCAAPG